MTATATKPTRRRRTTKANSVKAKTSTKTTAANSKVEQLLNRKDDTLLDRIYNVVQVGIPALLVGPPGAGKSARLRQIADKMGAEFVDVRLSLYDPVDVRGLPYIPNNGNLPSAAKKQVEDQIQEQVQQQVAWAKPDFVARAHTGKKVLICYEEINCASISTMNTALQFILDKRVGEHILGDNVYQVACCNRKGHRAFVNPMSAPLINRFFVCNVEPDVDEFLDYAVKNDLNDAVVAFIKTKPLALSVRFDNAKLTDKDSEVEAPNVIPNDEFAQFPTPRAWERTSKMIDAGLTSMWYLEGSIGKSAAIEFLAFMNQRESMPDIDALLNGDVTFDFKKAKVSVAYSVVTALIRRVVREPDRLNDAMRFLDDMRPEMGVMMVLHALQCGKPEVQEAAIQSKYVGDWMDEHYDLIADGVSDSE